MATSFPDEFPEIAAYLADTPSSVPPAAVAEWTRTAGRSVIQLMLDLVPWATASFPRPSISRFRVGAVGLGGSGALYFGGNLEFRGDALTSSVHAEQSATQNARGAGERTLSALAVSAAPCGYCRQFLYEIDGAGALGVYLADGTRSELSSLLPNAFGPRDLGVEGGLMDARAHGLRAGAGGRDQLIEAALGAANGCYAPYTKGYAGVAVAMADGATFVGGLAENAAYNPSMSPLEVALNAVALAGRAYDAITRAVLVEVRDAPASQEPATRALLRAVSGAELEVVVAEPPAR